MTRAGIADSELRDQATRAAKRVFLNLCEGLPDDRPAMRRKYFASADGSLHETVGAVDLAGAIGALGESEAAELLALALRLRAMLRGLMRRASSRSFASRMLQPQHGEQQVACDAVGVHPDLDLDRDRDRDLACPSKVPASGRPRVASREGTAPEGHPARS